MTQCHDTYVTEFRPNQEQECEENFWKACKITFKEVGYNYTLQGPILYNLFSESDVVGVK